MDMHVHTRMRWDCGLAGDVATLWWKRKRGACICKSRLQHGSLAAAAMCGGSSCPMIVANVISDFGFLTLVLGPSWRPCDLTSLWPPGLWTSWAPGASALRALGAPVALHPFGLVVLGSFAPGALHVFGHLASGPLKKQL